MSADDTRAEIMFALSLLCTSDCQVSRVVPHTCLIALDNLMVLTIEKGTIMKSMILMKSMITVCLIPILILVLLYSPATAQDRGKGKKGKQAPKGEQIKSLTKSLTRGRGRGRKCEKEPIMETLVERKWPK